VEAYARYAISANRAATFLGWFERLRRSTRTSRPASFWRTSFVTRPGEEGKWFAAAKDAKLFDEAVALANATPCDPKTLTRAARDFAQTNPALANEAGSQPFVGRSEATGYEVASLDVRAAYSHTLTAAANAGVVGAVRTRICALFDGPAARSGFVASVIGKDAGIIRERDRAQPSIALQ
jgi:hypothetical protein